MKIEILHQYFLKSTGICTDTRRITKGCIFFALTGDNFNGNKFAHQALDMGATKVIIDQINYHKNTGETVLCSSSLRMLQRLALYHRKHLGLPIIALTGSNGKTTTKELINVVLKQNYDTVATKGNLNNHIGVPLTLLTMKKDTEIGIVEMGANHLLEIDELCKITLPDFGYITNFGKAHLEGFGSVEGVIKGKTELYKHIHSHEKMIFVNGNDPLQLHHSKGINKLTFGNEEQDCHIQLLDATRTLKIRFKDTVINSNLIGLYNFHNIAAAIAIGDYFKISTDKIKKAIEGYVPSNNRSQLVEKSSNKIILDAYNANPTSMLAALGNFKQTEGENKILFLGDMFELGSESKSEHQNIVAFLEKNQIGKTYLIGHNFFETTTQDTSIVKLETFEGLKEIVETNPPKNSYLLIKASRGMALERILDSI